MHMALSHRLAFLLLVPKPVAKPNRISPPLSHSKRCSMTAAACLSPFLCIYFFLSLSPYIQRPRLFVGATCSRYLLFGDKKEEEEEEENMYFVYHRMLVAFNFE
ncbi:uncharacterized protein TrAFT101_007563 [Trichoderma asperellum]|uniref:Uncharacterized protein n=1 Tax=Trichoderma asperellum (strain ATCC 204424 / CBS 433.97 / NBRC 101777) TaxID=1042311 RepID=A0A2T3Z4D0_TRIA4|nr:hypothetical protein M441DRAFT_441929 [Trichoderma asperellum CBS 433.97]PTB39659.1 hypothetical protein M441DRAFT_441929 [Trichoderma asperellum CBS 433.97]UKZ92622.1 hypothetical protein TrAFT101_007563 [Trichoderma asperellum]